MQVVVLGAGAIGTFYAARLAQQHRVALIARRPEHVEAIRRDGVQVTGLAQLTAQVDVATEIPTLEADALVLLTTKVYDSAEAVRRILALLRPDTTILCLQNGLQSEQIVKDITGGRCTVLRGITDFGAIFEAPGRVTLKARGPTLIEAGTQSHALADMFSACELNGRVAPNIKQEVWRKLVVNCVINPLTAMTGMEVGWIADERLDPLKRRLVEECLAVARIDGVTFDADVTRALNDTYRPSRNLSSMYQDLLNGKQTEIEHMNGAVVELGRRFGVACPLNESLATIIRTLSRRGAAEIPKIPKEETSGISGSSV